LTLNFWLIGGDYFMRRQDRGNRHSLQTFGEAAEATVKSLKRGVQRRHAQDAELIPPNGSDSIQYNLFAYFTDDSGDLSNSIELWDAIPKYCDKRYLKKLRDENGKLDVLVQRFELRGVWYTVEVDPTTIRTSAGRQQFLPTADEELIEEVLKKIFSDQRQGIHNPKERESLVRWSLRMIRKELKERGHTRSLEQIRQSLNILAGCIIRLYVDGKKQPIYTGPILSDLVDVTRDDWLDNPKKLLMARLPLLVSASINRLEYREFNYDRLMTLENALARWFLRRLIHNFTQAGGLNTYDILFSTIERDSGLITSSDMSRRVKQVDTMFAELQEQEVLISVDKDERRSGRGRGGKINDILYRCLSHPNFTAEVKAANWKKYKSADILGRDPEANRLLKLPL
jgi:hypothetical protein